MQFVQHVWQQDIFICMENLYSKASEYIPQVRRWTVWTEVKENICYTPKLPSVLACECIFASVIYICWRHS